MLAVCDRYFRERENARDALQEGFVKVFEKLDTFSKTSPLEAWIRRIMVNTCIDQYRKQVQEPYMKDIDEVYDLSGHEETALEKLQYKDLLDCVRELPDGYRTIFNLYVIEGYTHSEIGTMLDISEGTSKSQLHKARHLLKQEIARKMTVKP